LVSKGSRSWKFIGEDNLGECYENGLGVSVDNEKAFYWYQKAAEAGNSLEKTT